MSAETEISPKTKVATAVMAIATLLSFVGWVTGQEFTLDEESATAIGSVLTLLVGLAAFFKKDPRRH